MSLRETIERIRSSPEPPNEEAAKFQILAPILAGLSWDPFGQEVLWEHPVGGKKRGGKVDIALRAEGHIWALIEAKTPGANLNNHVEQVLGYAFFEGVEICALSDGLHWWLYLPRESRSHEERRFSVLSLDKDPVDQTCSDLATFLGRDSLLGGQAVERAQQVLRALREAARLEKEMPAIWQQMLAMPDDELVKLIGQRVYDKLSLRPGRNQIVAVLRNRPIPPNQPPTSAPATPEPPNPDLPPKIKPTAFMLWGERHPVQLHSDILVTVVEQLYRRYPERFEQTVEPLQSGPWMGKGGPWQYASLDRRRVPGTNPKRTPSGLWVNVKMASAPIMSRAIELLEAFGHSESDLQLLYEDDPGEKPERSERAPKKRARRPVAVRILGNRHSVKYHQDVLVTVVNELHRRHRGDFDYTVARLKSGEWQYVASDPRLVRDINIKQTASGHYLDVNLNAATIKSRAIELLEAFGYSESDLQLLYEDDPGEKPERSERAPKKRARRPVAVRILGNRHSVKYHQDVLVTVVNELHRRHRGDFDYTVARLKSGAWQYVASDPRLVRDISIKQTASGHHVDVNLDAATIKSRAIELLKAFGYSESDLEYIYE
ncbi:MAG: hypothetical protein OXE79_01770 [Acidimicrobiaceae bacterium]|nr:hypothetical protein [Acidimicrobiaceae bacterium]